MITQKEIRKLFSYNKKTGILRWKVKSSKRVNIGDIAGHKQSSGYLQVGIKGKQYLVHRIIWCGVYGYFPENDIDHKDKIKHHNWLNNLRESSKQCNQRNTKNRKNNTSGVKGISWEKSYNKWIAYIAINKKLKFLGRYNEFENAVCARLAAEQCLDWQGCDSESPAYQYVKENIL